MISYACVRNQMIPIHGILNIEYHSRLKLETEEREISIYREDEIPAVVRSFRSARTT